MSSSSAARTRRTNDLDEGAVDPRGGGGAMQ